MHMHHVGGVDRIQVLVRWGPGQAQLCTAEPQERGAPGTAVHGAQSNLGQVGLIASTGLNNDTGNGASSEEALQEFLLRAFHRVAARARACYHAVVGRAWTTK